MKTLKVDCYGYTFQRDEYIMYDYDDDTFYEDGTANEVTTIDLYEDPEYLQPTKPLNFICTNPCSTGQHPNFTLDAPSHPSPGVTFKYNIYRHEYQAQTKCVAENWETTSWTDNEIVIVPYGTYYIYYATAKTACPEESDHSNYVSIWGGPPKAIPATPDNEQPDPDISQKINSFRFFCLSQSFQSKYKDCLFSVYGRFCPYNCLQHYRSRNSRIGKRKSITR